MRFDDVKVDDQVIVDPPGSGCKIVCHVERVTAKQFTAGGYRFTKGGNQVGGDAWYFAMVDYATPELIAIVLLEQRYSVARAELRRKLNSLDTLLREIDRNHDSYKWAATLEKALPHLTAAAEVLKLRVEVQS